MLLKFLLRALIIIKQKVSYKSGFYRGFMGNDPPEELNDENSKLKFINL